MRKNILLMTSLLVLTMVSCSKEEIFSEPHKVSKSTWAKTFANWNINNGTLIVEEKVLSDDVTSTTSTMQFAVENRVNPVLLSAYLYNEDHSVFLEDIFVENNKTYIKYSKDYNSVKFEKKVYSLEQDFNSACIYYMVIVSSFFTPIFLNELNIKDKYNDFTYDEVDYYYKSILPTKDVQGLESDSSFSFKFLNGKVKDMIFSCNNGNYGEKKEYVVTLKDIGNTKVTIPTEYIEV